MEAGGRFGERFKMSALRPFWSRRELFMMTWPIQTLSSVPVFLDSADPSLRNCVRASLCHPPTEFATTGTGTGTEGSSRGVSSFSGASSLLKRVNDGHIEGGVSACSPLGD